MPLLVRWFWTTEFNTANPQTDEQVLKTSSHRGQKNDKKTGPIWPSGHKIKKTGMFCILKFQKKHHIMVVCSG